MTDKFKTLRPLWRYMLSIAVGAIYPLAFAPLNWWPLAIVSIAFFWQLLKNTNPKTAFRTGFFYGFGLFGVGVSWVYVSINTFGNAPPFLAFLLTIGCIAFLSSLFALLAWSYNKYCSRFSGFTQVISFALLWLGFNLLQGTGFVNFPWLYLGYSQTGNVFMGLGSIVGVHGITFFIVILAVLCSEIIFSNSTGTESTKSSRVNNWFVFMAYFLLGLGLSWFGITGKVEQKQSLTVALIQPNVDQHKKWDREYFGDIVSGMLKQSNSYWGADLVVWPEAAIPAMDNQVDWLLKDLSVKARESGSTFITGIPILPNAENPQEYYAGIKMFGQQESEYHKQQLVPFGEYLPFQSVLRGLIEFFDLPMSSFTRGDSSQTGLESSKVYLIPAICYEIAFSGLIQDLSTKSSDENKPKAILTISNDTWFGQSWGPLQHFQMVQMRAIENGLPVIRGTNNGLTALINHYGQVLDQEPRFEKAVLAGIIPLDNRHTWFGQFGYWILAILCALLGIMAVIFRKAR